MPNYNNLSDYTFIPFEVNRLRNASVYWVNSDLVKDEFPECKKLSDEEIQQFLLDNFAFMVPPSNIDFDYYFTEETKIYNAERYGSHGETCNGGGVRCGNYRNVQVKGAGKNPLANEYMDFWHTHGSASLEESVRESVWGEFFHENAPFGAARILAIITTGMDIDFDYSYGELDGTSPPGALMLRQTIVRPAHFERAMYFNSNLPFDFYRVQENCEKLEEITGVGNSTVFIEHQINYFAYLAAWLKVNRISHGAITTGNIGVDGILIDFGTATTFLDHGNYLISKGFPPFWGDHAYFSNILKTLSFYLNKYTNDALLNADDIENQFFDRFNTYLSQFWLYQTGFHVDFCRVDSETHNRFSAAVNLLATACDNVERHAHSYRDLMARYNIVNILKILSKYGEKIESGNLSREIPEEKYAKHVVERFRCLIDEYNLWKVENNTDDSKSLLSKCEERNKDLVRLTRHELLAEVTDNIKNETDITNWMKTLIEESKMAPSPPLLELEVS